MAPEKACPEDSPDKAWAGLPNGNQTIPARKAARTTGPVFILSLHWSDFFRSPADPEFWNATRAPQRAGRSRSFRLAAGRWLRRSIPPAGWPAHPAHDPG